VPAAPARSALPVLVATLALAALVAPGPAAARPAPLPCVELPDDRCEAWTSVHDDADGASQFPAAVAVSPDGATVVATASERPAEGSIWDATSIWLLVAMDAATGETTWQARPAGLERYSVIQSVAVAPDGSTVYATGTTRDDFGDPSSVMVTMAFDAATGAERWRAFHDGAPEGLDGGIQVLVTPDRVVSVGFSGNAGDRDYGVVVHDAATGEAVWSTRWDGTGGSDSPFEATLSPDGTLLYVTGWSDGLGEFNVDYGTAAFHLDGPEAGETAWEARYDGVGVRAPDQAYDLAVGPEGTVYVTGLSNDVDGGPPFGVNYEIATVAYDGASGNLRWEHRRTWEGRRFNVGAAVAATEDLLVVAGHSTDMSARDTDMVTLGLDPDTGALRWEDRYATPNHQGEYAADVLLAGDRAYVTGTSGATYGFGQLGVVVGTVSDTATTAFAPDGTRDWTARLNATAVGSDGAEAMTASDQRLFVLSQVTRNVEPGGDFYDVGVAAYDLP
jgi:hypothetical protein